MALSKGLVRQRGQTQTPGLSEIVILTHQGNLTYTAGTNAGTVATIAAPSAVTAYRFVLPDNLGNYAIAFNGRTKEHAITLNFNSEALNATVWDAFNDLEQEGPMLVFARGKKQGSDNAWRILGQQNGLIVTAGTEDTATSGTPLTGLLTFTGVESTKPQWLELTASEAIDGAFTNITVSTT